MNSKELLAAIPYNQIKGELPEQIKHLTIDSRDIQPDSLFVCIAGYTVDGHDFAQRAADQGATVIVAENR